MEICIRPENAKSLRVVEKLGFRYEGLKRRYIHINGDWRDHYCFGLVTRGGAGGGAAPLAARAARPPTRPPCRRRTGGSRRRRFP